MPTILLNSQDINSGNIITKTIQHDSAPPIAINELEIARSDGVKLISSNYTPKTIEIEGHIKGADQNNLELNIDAFKKAISGTRLNLDVSYNGGTRRYVVNVTNIIITREHFNITYSPFTIVCTTSDAPFGRDTSTSEGLSVDELTQREETLSVDLGGTAEPKPTILFRLDTVGILDRIIIRNNTTNTQMDISSIWSDSDQLEIDTENRSVELNGQPIGFEGIFPEFDLGLNNITLYLYGTFANHILQEDYNNQDWIAQGKAQSIDPAATAQYQSINVLLDNPGASAKTVTWELRNDSGGNPTGSVIESGSFSVPASSGLSWYTLSLPTLPTLTNGTDYWIKLVESDSFVSWALDTSAPYANGSVKIYGGGTWSAVSYDCTFRVYGYAAPDWNFDTKITYTKRYL
jgi:hypothetical protein